MALPIVWGSPFSDRNGISEGDLHEEKGDLHEEKHYSNRHARRG